LKEIKIKLLSFICCYNHGNQRLERLKEKMLSLKLEKYPTCALPKCMELLNI
jgi:hypothetical protein